jgi:hypothetical protein
MNAYPSWIHRIPEMIEALALLDREWIDRELVERIFDLRKTAAFHLLRRMGAQRCGNSLVIGRGLLMARLREAHENHDWRWESERRQAVQQRIESLETQGRRKSLVTVEAALAKQMEELSAAGLPGTVQLAGNENRGQPSRAMGSLKRIIDWKGDVLLQPGNQLVEPEVVSLVEAGNKGDYVFG